MNNLITFSFIDFEITIIAVIITTTSKKSPFAVTNQFPKSVTNTVLSRINIIQGAFQTIVYHVKVD